MNNKQPSRNWPADKVERRGISTLIPAARNARRHSEQQIEQIAQSMKEWGWTIPVLIDEDNGIIAGHGRVLAGGRLGFAEVPVMVAVGWSEEKKRAYQIADNKLALNAEWDFDVLRDEVLELREAGFDFAAAGFTSDEIEALFAPDNDALREWRGMPEFEQNDRMAFKTIAVHFADAEAVQRFAELIGQPIGEKTRYVWFPQRAAEAFSRYAAA